MYHHYVNTHKEINPWTADYTAFRAELPEVAVYARSGNSIMSVAYIEDNEIAYVCSLSEQYFLIFAKALMQTMFMKHDNIFFECDNCDWVAMTLRSLFINQDESSFCTYILEDDNECKSNMKTSSFGI